MTITELVFNERELLSVALGLNKDENAVIGKIPAGATVISVDSKGEDIVVKYTTDSNKTQINCEVCISA